MNHHHLTQLHESTEEDMRFGVGTIMMPDGQPCPIINIHYADWSREKLEVVRESFMGGVILSSAERRPGVHDVYIGTRESIAIQQQVGEHTSILRAPAWDARLEGIEPAVLRQFDQAYSMLGRFLLILQTDRWAFEADVTECGTIKLGKIE